MLKEISTKIQNMSYSVKTLLYTNLFKSFIVGIFNVFLSIMIFDITGDISFTITFLFFKYAGSLSMMYLYNYYVLKYNKDIKSSYTYFVFLLLSSFTILLFSNYNEWLILLFSYVYGMGIGMYYFTQHMYSLKKTEIKDRDFFSSMMVLSGEILSIIIPLTVIISIYVSDELLDLGKYNILILLMVLVSFIMLFFVKNLDSYYPKKQNLKKIIKKIKDNENRNDLFWFTLYSGSISMVQVIIFTYVSLVSMKEVINIGIVELITGLFSILLIMKLSTDLYSKDRLKYMKYSVLITGVAYIILLLSGLSVWGYVLYSILLLISGPMYATALQVMDLKVIELLKSENEYGLGILIRETLLTISRILSGGLLYIVYIYTGDSIYFAYVGVIIFILIQIGTYITSKKILESENC